MFSILDGRDKFYQWDTGRKLVIEDNTIKEVHFANCLCPNARVCEVYTHDDDFGGIQVVNVPDELLQEYMDIRAWAYDGEMTKHEAVFEVVKRTKPDAYVYTPTERKDYNTLNRKIDNVDSHVQSVDYSLYEYKQENNQRMDNLETEALWHVQGHGQGTYSDIYNDVRNIASGYKAHAEGSMTEATGSYTHAEGFQSKAKGNYSHAEGHTTEANGVYSHSEGYQTVATGNYSHAQNGNTEANGSYSTAMGRGTAADGSSQLTIGRFNKRDTAAQYAFIIGNGTSNNGRKNILTVDWDGSIDTPGTISCDNLSIASDFDVLGDIYTEGSVRAIGNISATGDFISTEGEGLFRGAYMEATGEMRLKGDKFYLPIDALHFYDADRNIWQLRIKPPNSFEIVNGGRMPDDFYE